MKAILTHKGARRLGVPNRANTIVDITDLRVMPWGSRNATLWVDGVIVAGSVPVYTPNHGKDCELILQEEAGR